LRGPLNAIHTWAHVLERKLGETDASVGRALAGIRAGVEQQVSLIEKIIDAPRMATRHLAITRSPVALKAVCDDVIANARVTQQGAIALEWSGEARDAVVDAERLWQAWWWMLAYAHELVADAAEHAASLAAIGAPADVRVLRVSIEQGTCVSTLTTAAPPRERHEFEQGLALPRRVAEAHGGQCSVEPNDESGEVTITLVIGLTGRD
jgi:signal transduction histidine kinase